MSLPVSRSSCSTTTTGGIGQPLALLLKASPLISSLSLFDIVNTPGVAADLGHIATPSKVEGFLPPDDGLAKALAGADVVVIPAGVPRKPGVSFCVDFMSIDC